MATLKPELTAAQAKLCWQLMSIGDSQKQLEMKKLSELRKLERQAKALLYKMERIEVEWRAVKSELLQIGRSVPHQLGDVLGAWRKTK